MLRIDPAQRKKVRTYFLWITDNVTIFFGTESFSVVLYRYGIYGLSTTAYYMTDDLRYNRTPNITIGKFKIQWISPYKPQQIKRSIVTKLLSGARNIWRKIDHR